MLDFEAVTTIVCLGPSGWGARRIAWTPGIARNTVRRVRTPLPEPGARLCTDYLPHLAPWDLRRRIPIPARHTWSLTAPACPAT